ncbi:pentapeptide repeat-containing protein [Actinoplanes sp. CA-051413]|uniref:pentapeptide repeat-containing protein n=1 Tax=Actinoplanes sp. CA-051413 TaxID=3239899 RepID=UPI003D95DC04
MNFNSKARSRSPFTIWPRSLLGHVALLLTLGTALAVLLGVLLWAGLGKPDGTAPTPNPSASAAARPLTAAERLDSIKLILATVGGVGAVVALTVAYRKQRHGEAAEDRETDRILRERFAKAVDQLGHEQARVRVAGVYAMADLADDWEKSRQMCIDVLCAYIRMPYDPHGAEAGAGEREVRRTLFRVLRNHLRPETRWSETKWSGYRFSFEGAVLDSGDLSGAELTSTGHMTFHRVTFAGRFYFDGVRLHGAPMWFSRATFAGQSVTFDHAVLTGSTIDFSNATFADGNVSFKNVQAPAAANFDGARHIGGTVDWGPFTPLPPPPVSGPASALTRLAKAVGSARSRRGARPGRTTPP